MLSQKYLTMVVAFLAICILGADVVWAEVWVNMLWNEQEQAYTVQPLILDGGETFDRGYQNAYGEANNMDPGPPFKIQATIQAGGTISFESGGFDPLNPFVVNVEPSGDNSGLISAVGGVNFIGTFLDPITVSGAYKLWSGTDYGRNGPHPVWSNTTFRCTRHEETGNGVPFVFTGCSVTIDQCRFPDYGTDFARLMSIDDYSLYDPIYEAVIRNCVFENLATDLSPYPITIRGFSQVSIEGCDFDSVVFTEIDYAGLVEIRLSGIKSIKDNTGRRNTLNKFHVIETWAADSAYIETSDDLPIVSTNIRVDADSALAIGPGSVVKFLYTGGIDNSGRLYLDSAVLTSSQDDSHGGDTDLEPQPVPIINKWNTTSGWGVNIGAAGTLSMKNSEIYHAWGGVYAEGPVTAERCRISDCKRFGFYLDGAGADTFRISSTEILRTLEDGEDAGIYYRHDVGYPQLLDLDSVTIMSTDGPGLLIPYIGDGTTRVELDACRIIDNYGYGIYFTTDPVLLGFTVKNSLILGNYASGIYALTQFYEGGGVHVEGNVVVGNGHGQYASNLNGLVLPNNPLTAVGNTIAYNAGVGLSYWDIAEIEQCVVTNNLFLRNGDYGLGKTDAGEQLLAANNFWENGDEEIRYRGPDGTLYTVEEVQALGGDFATNLHVNPDLIPERFGTGDQFEYDAIRRISKLVDADGHFSEHDLVGRFICPDTMDPHWYYITYQLADTLYIVGDISGSASMGDIYRIHDFHLSNSSPLLDVGHHASVSVPYDIDGSARIIDGNEDGFTYVDIGADEYDPNEGVEPPIRITAPSGGEFFGEGDECTITWEVDGVSNVHIIFISDYDSAPAQWDTLAKDVDASPGTYDWEVPFNLTMEATIRIEDASDQNVFARSDKFRVKGDVLARIGTDSTLVRFWPEVDSWRFGNDAAMMWPATWYNQIDYVNGVDPYTNQVYPPFFANELFYNAQSSDFPSWTTWVGAFGEDQCYMNGPQGRMYRTEALAAWSDFKGPWQGSCFGFGVSSALAFFDSAAFLGDYPEVGVFGNLHELDTTDARREAINRLFCHQRGATHREYRNNNSRNTSRETLTELKEMMRENFVNGRMMAIGKRGEGGHVVNPFRIDQVSGQPGKYRVYIYDSEFPVGDMPSDYDTLFIDSASNTWSSIEYADWNGQGSFCYLLDSSASYLEPPVLPGASGAKRSVSFASASADPFEVYHNGLTQLLIEDGVGNVTGFDDAAYFEEIPDAVPLMVLAGAGESVPEGFMLPDGAYEMSLASSESAVITASIWDGPLIYRYSRTGVDASQTDALSYDTSVAIGNTDADPKQCQVACAAIGTDEEKQYVVKGLTMDNGDEMEFFTLDGESFNILNAGSGKTCAMEIWFVSTSGGAIAEAQSVSLPGAGLSTVVPNWTDPQMDDVKILFDYDVDGTYDDSTQLSMITSIGGQQQGTVLPDRFQLSQNYPNPFNPVTTIEYALPKRSHVKINVYNILGQQVRTLVDTDKAAGYHAVYWNGTDASGKSVSTGIYLYRIEAGDYTESRKMLLLK